MKGDERVAVARDGAGPWLTLVQSIEGGLDVARVAEVAMEA